MTIGCPKVCKEWPLAAQQFVRSGRWLHNSLLGVGVGSRTVCKEWPLAAQQFVRSGRWLPNSLLGVAVGCPTG